MKSSDKSTVIYDGDCKLCNSAVRFLKTNKSDNIFKFIPSSDPATGEILKDKNISTETTDKTVILIDKNRVYTKSTAIIKSLQKRGNLWNLVIVFFIIPRVLRDGIYDWIARRRKK
jgi:predicted DCC family thiol-disulfide oxidoreductase YuxK